MSSTWDANVGVRDLPLDALWGRNIACSVKRNMSLGCGLMIKCTQGAWKSESWRDRVGTEWQIAIRKKRNRRKQDCQPTNSSIYPRNSLVYHPSKAQAGDDLDELLVCVTMRLLPEKWQITLPWSQYPSVRVGRNDVHVRKMHRCKPWIAVWQAAQHRCSHCSLKKCHDWVLDNQGLTEWSKFHRRSWLLVWRIAQSAQGLLLFRNVYYDSCFGLFGRGTGRCGPRLESSFMLKTCRGVKCIVQKRTAFSVVKSLSSSRFWDGSLSGPLVVSLGNGANCDTRPGTTILVGSQLQVRIYSKDIASAYIPQAF